MSEEKRTAAEKYRQMLDRKPPQTVLVTAPSGFVFKRIKPSTFAILFDAGELPTAAADEAAVEWQKNGLDIGTVGTPADLSEKQKEDAARKALAARDRVITNSVEPKLVIGATQNENEISVFDLDPEDLSFLWQYEVSRGDDAVRLAMFPEGLEQRVISGIDSQKLRKARKRASGNKG